MDVLLALLLILAAAALTVLAGYGTYRAFREER